MSSTRSWGSLAGPAIACSLTALGWWRWRTPWSLGLLLAAASLLALALLAPAAFAPVERQLQRFGRSVAIGFTWGVLALLFGLIFIPVGIVLRLTGRDPLLRRPDPRRTSYWEPLAPSAGLAHFRRQF